MNYSTSRTYRSRKKTHGLALLEILIAIGILGLIAAGVASLASRTFEEQNANKINTDIVDMALAIQSAYKRQNVYAATQNNNVQELVTANVVASAVATNPVTNSVYTYDVAKRQANGPDDGFVIGIDGLNSSLCTSLVTGGLLDDANYLEVVAANSAGAGKVFDVAAAWDGTAATGVVKTSQGTSPSINDPLSAATVCGNATNKILVGFF